VATQAVGARVQGLTLTKQTLALARLAASRGGGRFTGSEVLKLFEDFNLPAPRKISNVLGTLRDNELIRRSGDAWAITPIGRQESEADVSGMDLAALMGEAATAGAWLAGAAHPVILPELGAPPELVPALHGFLTEHPFDRNVFGMTRFPPDEEPSDPVKLALDECSTACEAHGMEFHLASQRQLVDDLWRNVSAHMWACRYGVGIFEGLGPDAGRINYNLTIEVGGMLLAGRRCALLKDGSIDRMPSDLVGHIYKSVDLTQSPTVGDAMHRWIRDDLNLGPCADCPT
jgi:hypothetical protein